MELSYEDHDGRRQIWQQGELFLLRPKQVLLFLRGERLELGFLDQGRLRGVGTLRHDGYHRRLGAVPVLQEARFEPDEPGVKLGSSLLGLGVPHEHTTLEVRVASHGESLEVYDQGRLLYYAWERDDRQLWWTTSSSPGGVWAKEIWLGPSFSLKVGPIGPRSRSSLLAERRVAG